MSGECDECGDHALECRCMQWIKIDLQDDIPEPPFLLCDSHGFIYVGSTSFDYYDSIYWLPMPKFPMDTTITNDQFVSNLFRRKK